MFIKRGQANYRWHRCINNLSTSEKNNCIITRLATDSSGDIWKLIDLGFEKSQHSVTYDLLRYINIPTYRYLLTISTLPRNSYMKSESQVGSALASITYDCIFLCYG